jgi:hypothetical protein
MCFSQAVEFGANRQRFVETSLGLICKLISHLKLSVPMFCMKQEEYKLQALEKMRGDTSFLAAEYIACLLDVHSGPFHVGTTFVFLGCG